MRELDYILAGIVKECGDILGLRRKELEHKKVSDTAYLNEIGDLHKYIIALLYHFNSDIRDLDKRNNDRMSRKRAKIKKENIGGRTDDKISTVPAGIGDVSEDS